MTLWQQIWLWCGRMVVGLLGVLLLSLAADWLLWRVHLAHGEGMATVQVTRMVVAPLKGNREQYYMDGTEDVPCSRSLFPEGGASACWWLKRHRVVFVR